MTVSQHESAFPRHDAPELCRDPSPIEGAGNAGCPMHPQPRVVCRKHARWSPRSHRNHPAFPHAMVLTVSFVLSSVIGLSCHRRPQETCRKLASRELDAGVEASGPHDFAVRSWHHSSLVPPRPSHPRPTFVTIAKRPSVWAGMANDIEVIWVEREPEYFCEEDWTGVSVICPSGALHHVIFVIPGRERARKPYSLQGLWIPRSRQVARPGMT